jgi:IS605 OrfB family transposase
MILDYLKTGEAYQVEMIRKSGNYYCHITIDESKINKYCVKYTGHNGLVGVDTNPDGFALTMISRSGNYKWNTYLQQHELLYARTNRRLNLCGELVKQVINITKDNQCGIAIEDLKFIDDIDVCSKFARTKHQFIYRTLLEMLEVSCIREGIEITKVKPQFTSRIGLYKYCHQYGLPVHNGAAMVIARRAYGYTEKVPKLLKDKLIPFQQSFNKKKEWSKWAIINNELKKKEVKKPDFWITNRKQLLGIV